MIQYAYDVDDQQALMTLKEEMDRIDEIMTAGYDDPKNPNISKALDEIYGEIKEKYGLKTGATNFRDFLRGIIDETRVEHTVNLAIESKIVMSLATRLKIEMIISMTQLLERAMDLAMRDSFVYENLTPELIGMIDKLMNWMLKVNELRDSVNITDPNKAIDRAIELDKRENPNKYQAKTADEKAAQDSDNNIAIIKTLLAQMNNQQAQPQTEGK